MKKHNFVTGIVFTLAGIVFFLAALFTHNELDSLLCGVAGGLLGPGVIILYKYFYAKAHKQDKEFQEKQDREDIELHDELNEKLRAKAGQYTYVLGMVVLAVSMPIFVVLDALQLFMMNNLMFIGFLFIYLMFQIFAGNIIFKYLLKKFQ